MKVLLVSDLHYTLKQFDWLYSVADQLDLMVLAGDHLDVASMVEYDAQIVVVLKYLQQLASRTKLVVCSGNHDLNALSADGEKTAEWMSRVRQLGIPCDGDLIEFGGSTITICPWWDGPASRDQIGRQLAQDAEKRNGHWIWIYHAPPDESPVSWAGKKHFGDTELLAWINEYKPDMVLTGHIHQSPFKKDGSWVDRIGDTWVFNAGRQIGPVPAHIIFDMDDKKAMWFSLAGSEVVELDKPLQRPVAELV